MSLRQKQQIKIYLKTTILPACLLAWRLITDVRGQIEGVGEQGTEENI